ncbi:MAG: hypothetical protein VXW87_03100 [Pseudomonadota bacterium]|nr:hypothetical protein [Pseudomonadota bacterium]
MFRLQMAREAVEVHRQGKSLNLSMLIRNSTSLLLLTIGITSQFFSLGMILPLFGLLMYGVLALLNYLQGGHYSQMLNYILEGISNLHIPIISLITVWLCPFVTYYSLSKRQTQEEITEFEQRWSVPENAPGKKHPKLMAMVQNFVRRLPYYLLYITHGVIVYNFVSAYWSGTVSFGLIMYAGHLVISELHHLKYLPGYASKAWINLCTNLSQILGIVQQGILGTFVAIVSLASVVPSRVGLGIRDLLKSLAFVVVRPENYPMIPFLLDINEIEAPKPKRKSKLATKIGVAQNFNERYDFYKKMHNNTRHQVIKESHDKLVAQKDTIKLSDIYAVMSNKKWYRPSSICDRVFLGRDTDKSRRTNKGNKNPSNYWVIQIGKFTTKVLSYFIGKKLAEYGVNLIGFVLQFSVSILRLVLFQAEQILFFPLTLICYPLVKLKVSKKFSAIFAKQDSELRGQPKPSSVVEYATNAFQTEVFENSEDRSSEARLEALYRRTQTQVTNKLLALGGSLDPRDPYGRGQYDVAAAFDQLAPKLVNLQLEAAQVDRTNDSSIKMSSVAQKRSLVQVAERFLGKPYLESWLDREVQKATSDNRLNEIVKFVLAGFDYDLFNLSNKDLAQVTKQCEQVGVDIKEVYPEDRQVAELVGASDPRKIESIVGFLLYELSNAITSQDISKVKGLSRTIISSSSVCAAGLAAHWYCPINQLLGSSGQDSLDSSFDNMVYRWKGDNFDLFYQAILPRMARAITAELNQPGVRSQSILDAYNEINNIFHNNNLNEGPNGIVEMIQMFAFYAHLEGGQLVDVHKAHQHYLRHWGGVNSPFKAAAGQDTAVRLAPVEQAGLDYFFSYAKAYHMANNDWRSFVSYLFSEDTQNGQGFRKVLDGLRSQAYIPDGPLSQANRAHIQGVLDRIKACHTDSDGTLLSAVVMSGIKHQPPGFYEHLQSFFELYIDNISGHREDSDLVEAYNIAIGTGILDYDLVMQYMLNKGLIAPRAKLAKPSFLYFIKSGLKNIVFGIVPDLIKGVVFVLSESIPLIKGILFTPEVIRKKHSVRYGFWAKLRDVFVFSTIMMGCMVLPVWSSYPRLLASGMRWISKPILYSAGAGWLGGSWLLRSVNVSKVKGKALSSAVSVATVVLSFWMIASMLPMLSLEVIKAHAIAALITAVVLPIVSLWLAGFAKFLLDQFITSVVQCVLFIVKVPYMVLALSYSMMKSIVNVKENIEWCQSAATTSSEIFKDFKLGCIELKNDISGLLGIRANTASVQKPASR